MTVPQTPPPCPDWWASKHVSRIAPYSLHRGTELVTDDTPASVRIEQEWRSDKGPSKPIVSLLLVGHHARPIDLTAGQARALATQVSDPLATALRQAADELDRIPGGA